jgi:uncharacterized protein (UPF0333 family)
MEHKGQGALEYLLLIGGAILVAVIVIALIVGLGGTGGAEATKSIKDGLCAKYSDSSALCTSKQVLYSGTCYACKYNSVGGTNRCESNPTVAGITQGQPGATC